MFDWDWSIILIELLVYYEFFKVDVEFVEEISVEFVWSIVFIFGKLIFFKSEL